MPLTLMQRYPYTCDTCHALAGESCRTSSGAWCRPHASRGVKAVRKVRENRRKSG